ncbi:MAG TPA: GNAT family N-acetyltransferase [Candidatus Mediterraneibacter ornithocaccae]|nr:GNAT family N-acetyltransferase [Lachnoclostridium sp. An298]HJA20263.1 GNAT family N-acetyltransferase [Candidatus Mediterraneibacter ornithocaccae]
MIRKMTESDRDLYIEMAEEFYHSDAVLHPIPRAHFEKTAEEALKSGTYAEIYLLEYEGKTAGYGLTARTFSQEAGGQVLWIEELYIREAFRSRGLGREFFSYLEENNKGVLSRLRLEVEADNTRAISLYERLGYEVLDYVQMIKDFE